MALLKAEFDFNFEKILSLVKIYPDLSGRLLSLVGKRARTKLKQKYLSGQEITLSKFPRNSRGQYTIISDVNKKQDSVKIYSPTLQLFEKPHRLRSGAMSEGKYILSRKLKQDVISGLAGYTREFEKIILAPELKSL